MEFSLVHIVVADSLRKLPEDVVVIYWKKGAGNQKNQANAPDQAIIKDTNDSKF